MKKTLMENIEAYMAQEKKTIDFETFKVEVNEDVDVNEIHNAIEFIVNAVVEQDWSYDLIDIFESYYIISLFTNIPVPMLEDDIPDYTKCLEICQKLDLRTVLYEASGVIFEQISMLEKNIWRKLEYHKAMLTLVPWESLMDGLSQFYEVLDTLSEYVDQQKDVDIENLASQINDVASKLRLVEEMKNSEK